MKTAVADRSKHTGRPFGKANLPEPVKASIVTAKNLQVFSHQRIANDHNVSRQTVVNLTADKLKPETKALMEAMTDKLGRISHLVADRIEEKVINNDFKDGVYPQLFTAIYNAKRLEDGKSTQNIATNHIAENINTTLLTASKLHRADPSEPLPTPAEALELYRQACAKAGQECDETLIDLSVLEVQEAQPNID